MNKAGLPHPARPAESARKLNGTDQLTPAGTTCLPSSGSVWTRPGYMAAPGLGNRGSAWLRKDGLDEGGLGLVLGLVGRGTFCGGSNRTILRGLCSSTYY